MANEADPLCPTSKASHPLKFQLIAMNSRKLVPYKEWKKHLLTFTEIHITEWPHIHIKGKLNLPNRVATNGL